MHDRDETGIMAMIFIIAAALTFFPSLGLLVAAVPRSFGPWGLLCLMIAPGPVVLVALRFYRAILPLAVATMSEHKLLHEQRRHFEEKKSGPMRWIGLLTSFAAIGIGAGSLAAGRLSGDKVELGLAPIGSIGMGVFAILLSRSDAFEESTTGGLALLAGREEGL